MFKKIKEFFERGLYRLGILKGIESIAELKDVDLNDEMYALIDMYKDLYRGYHAPWHHVRYKTIDGWKERDLDTMNMAKAVAAEMASLVFNEKCEISIGDDKNETSEFVGGVLRHNRFYKKFQDYIEYCFSSGGMVVKPYVADDKVKLSFVTADCFYALAWDNETITEGLFVNELQKDGKKYTLLEFHTWIKGVYTVTNKLYESETGDNLGREVSLGVIYPDLEPVVGMPKIKKPLFVYFKPNTANNIDTLSPLGIPLYANALPTMKAIDTAFDSFHREFRLGKKRIIVPAHMVKVTHDENGQPQRYFDPNDETYDAFDGDMDAKDIHDISVELRVDEHVAAINALLNLFSMQTGFSSGSFTFDGQSMKTATEVISEQSKTFKSKQSHEVIIEAGLQELIEAILAIASDDLYGLFTGEADLDIQIAFDDSIAEDKAAEINKQVQLVGAELQSKKRAIRKIFGVTEEEAEEIMTEIVEEIKAAAPDVSGESILLGGTE